MAISCEADGTCGLCGQWHPSPGPIPPPPDPIDVVCPRCAANPGVLCVQQPGEGEVTFHDERYGEKTQGYDPIGGGGGSGRSDLPYGMGGGGD